MENNEEEQQDDGNTPSEIEELLRKLHEVDMEELNESIDPKTKKNLHAEKIVSIIEEYLDPFVIFGYDINGNAVVINNAQNQKDLDSLTFNVGRYMSTMPMGNSSDDIGDMS